ncbi:MAG: hypothetical protein NTX53_08855 [candidate division WOR-3 bacterium]|nr:hypothetical protein [candidate division WOR-3 bacterium]
MRGLLRRKFDDYRVRFPSRWHTAEACKQFARHDEEFYNANPIDSQFYAKLVSLESSDADCVFDTFLTLRRGYADRDVAYARSTITRDHKRLARLVAAMLAKNDRRQRTAARLGGSGSLEVTAFADNRKELQRLLGRVNSLRNNLDAHARAKCRCHVRERRMPGLATMAGVDGDYTGIRERLARLDPDFLLFPMRHALQLPVRVISILKALWKRGATLEQLTDFLVRTELTDEYLEAVCQNFDELAATTGSRRPGNVREACACYRAGHYAAAAMLIIVQTEAILWDYCEYLNRKGAKLLVRSRVRRGRPVYYAASSPGVPPEPAATDSRAQSRTRLTSARSVLQHTDLKRFLYAPIYDYLLREFSDDRNDYAHNGLPSDRLLAMRALLTLDAAVTGAASFLSTPFHKYGNVSY